MKSLVKNRATRAALIAGLVAAAWSPSSFACSDTPVLASVCIMAVPTTFGSFNRQFVMAAGQELPINSYTALYSLIGVTYGGDARTNFKLPDLRGKFLIGADGVNYRTGATGGRQAVTLLATNVPSLPIPLGAATVDLSKITVATTLATLSGTATIAAATVSGTVSGLKMNVVNGGAGSGTPSGNFLGKSPAPAGSLYSTAGTPDATLNDKAITGGAVSVTVPASSAPLALTWTGATTSTLGGTATVAGNAAYTNNTPAAIDITPPYIAMTYYINVSNGIYPSRD